MAYNTGNQIGSTDPRDLLDNSENLDQAINSTSSTWVDRFGVTRKTFQAAENAADDAEVAANNAITALIPAEVARVETDANAAINTEIPAEVQRAADYVETVLEQDTSDALDMSVAKSAMRASFQAGRAETARDLSETYAGVVSRSVSADGLTDPATLTLGDLGYVSGSGDDAVDGVYEVQDDTGNVWARIGDTGLAGKFSVTDGEQLRLSTGNAMGSSATALASADNGASVNNASITIPAGQTGNNSLVQIIHALQDIPPAGTKILVRTRFATSNPYTRNNVYRFRILLEDETQVFRPSFTLVKEVEALGYLEYESEYTLQGDEIGLACFTQILSSAITSVDENIAAEHQSVAVIAPSDNAKSASDEAFDLRTKDIFAGFSPLDEITSRNESFYFSQAFNGATVNGSLDTVTIPPGQSGNLSLLQSRWPKDFSEWTGVNLRSKIELDVSDVFNRTLLFRYQVVTSGGDVVRPSVVTRTVKPGQIVYTSDYVIKGDEIAIQPYIQISGSGPASSEQFIKLVRWWAYITSTASIVQSPAAFALEELVSEVSGNAARRAQSYPLIPALRYDTTAIVAPSGGDYTSPAGALSAITDASQNNRYLICTKPGVYEDSEWFDKDYVDFVGESKQESHVKFHQANDTAPLLMATKSAIFQRNNSRLEGLLITAKNARYAIHLESDGNIPDAMQEVVNCHVEHFGNDDGIGNYWGAQYAIGSGNSSGQVIRIVDTTCISKRRGGFSYHTNLDFDAPSRVELIRSRFIARQAGENSFEMKPLGSFQADTCYAQGCVFAGDIATIVKPWLQTDISKQPADHNEITLTGYGNSPAVYRNYDFGESLRIDSATTGDNSSVAISGNAVSDIFGDTLTDRYFERAGSPGFSAAVWGWGDISVQSVGVNEDVLNKTLGQRLGDCSSASKTLTVAVDSSAVITVTFNQDHTAQDNATVLGIINTALGSAATASIYKPGARKRPMFSDEEVGLKNTSGAGVVAGTVMAFDGSYLQCRPMISTDPKALFAGVVWGDDVASSDVARIKSRGYIHRDDVTGGDAVSTAFGNTFSIDPEVPGKIIEGGSQGILMAIGNQSMKVN